MYAIGETKAFRVECSDGVKNSGTYLQPPPGYEWILHWLWASQGHAGAVNTCLWYVRTESENMNVSLTDEIQLNTNEKMWFAPHDGTVTPGILAPMPFWYPVRFTQDTYPYFNCSLMDPGEYITCQGMIIERPANLELTLADWFAHLVGHKLPGGLEGLKFRIEHYRGGI